MLISVGLINGFMVGLEIDWGNAVIFDLGIIRLVCFYGDPPDEE